MPELRYQTMSELLADLKILKDGGSAEDLNATILSRSLAGVARDSFDQTHDMRPTMKAEPPVPITEDSGIRKITWLAIVIVSLMSVVLSVFIVMKLVSGTEDKPPGDQVNNALVTGQKGDAADEPVKDKVGDDKGSILLKYQGDPLEKGNHAVRQLSVSASRIQIKFRACKGGRLPNGEHWQ